MAIKNLRNFWISTIIDGRKTKLEGGPKSKDGGLRTDIIMRENGKSKTALTITCTPLHDDLLQIAVYDDRGTVVFNRVFDR
jgi:hypothetical protein